MLVYIPLITPLWEGLVYPVINGVAIGVFTGTTAVFGGVGYVLTNLTSPRVPASRRAARCIAVK